MTDDEKRQVRAIKKAEIAARQEMKRRILAYLAHARQRINETGAIVTIGGLIEGIERMETK